MRWLALALLPAAWLAAVFQTVVAPAMAIRSVSPDALALLASMALLIAPVDRRTVWIAAAMGLVADLISAGPFGAATLSFSLAALAVVALRGKLVAQALPVRLLFTALFATLSASGIALLYLAAGETSLGLATLLTRALGIGLYTAFVSLPIYLVISWLPDWTLATSH